MATGAIAVAIENTHKLTVTIGLIGVELKTGFVAGELARNLKGMGIKMVAKKMLTAARKYSEAIGSSVCIELKAWRHTFRNEYYVATLWVDTTRTHYDFPTIEDLLETVYIKTLLHRKFQ